MGTLSFTPNVSNSGVFSTVTNIIASTLLRADAVYSEAQKNLEEIKKMIEGDYSVLGIYGGVASKIGINADAYHSAGFMSNIAQSFPVEVSLPTTLDPPDKITLGTISNSISFVDDIDFDNKSAVEPDKAVSYWIGTASTLLGFRPPKETLTTVSTDVSMDSASSSGTSIVEPDTPSLDIDEVVDDIKAIRPSDLSLAEINTTVLIDPAEKPSIAFVQPPIPDLPPLTDIPKPEFSFNYAEPFYTSELGSVVYNMLLSELQNGSTGLTAAIESDIYSRESERDSLELQNTKDKIANMWAETGLSLPDGVLVSALASAELEYQNRYSDKSRDVRIESFKRADDNAKFVKDLTVKYEQILMDYMAGYWARQLDAAKAIITYMAALYDAILKYHTIFNERYKAEVEGYKATIEGQAAELEAKAKVYDSEIKYVSAKADVEVKKITSDIEVQRNKIQKHQVDTARYESEIRLGSMFLDDYKTDVDKYNAIASGRIAELNAKTSVYDTDVKYVSAKAEYDAKAIAFGLEKQKNELLKQQVDIARYAEDLKFGNLYLDNFKADIEQYNTIYSLRMKDIETELKYIETQMQYHLGKADIEAKRVGVEVETQKAQIEAKRLEIDVFDSELKYEIAKADVDVKEIVTKLDREKTTAAVHQANIAFSDVDVKYRIGKLNALLESTKQEIDMMKISVEAAISATGNIAQVSSTMVAGALSSLNANASIGTSESQNSSVSESNSHSESTSKSYNNNFNHNYDAS